MTNNENKKNVLKYAVIFFSCALIVLIVTGYSQIKFSNSINEYKNILTNQEKEKVDFNINLSTALSQNNKLIEEIQTFKEELQTLRNENDSLSEEVKELAKNSDNSILEYEKLLKADELYEKNDYKECIKILLKEINLKYLSNNAVKKYNKLYNTVCNEAALQFFKDGYSNYKKENYEEAIYNLKLSLELGENFYFSDDCYYYISYSYYRLGNTENVINTANEMLDKYPDSSYKKEVQNLIKLTNNN
ncbi:MAG: hypothetical protein GX660_14625 [Clostridiaceae bacterium]|nr:hypothetical protein [Clostridiaceae bacterium]